MSRLSGNLSNTLLTPITPKLYKNNENEIKKINANLLIILGTIGMIVYAGYLTLILSNKLLETHYLYSNRISSHVYIFMFLYSLTIVIYGKYFTAQKNGLILPFFYLFFIFVFSYGIYDRFFAIPTGQVFTIELVMLILPIILLDRTWRLFLIEYILLLIYAFFDFRYKGRLPRFMWRDDFINVIICSIIGFFGGHAIRYSRIQALENGRIFILQRNTDELTTLPNRRKLFHELRKSTDGRSTQIKYLFIADIDFFKKYNDTFGHPAGDVVLQKIGICFSHFAEKTGFEIYRYGGEEFIGIYRAAQEINIDKTMHLLCKNVHDLKIERALKDLPYVTISIGYASEEKTHPLGYEDFISKADNALYEAKAKGRNCVIEYNDSMQGNTENEPCRHRH